MISHAGGHVRNHSYFSLHIDAHLRFLARRLGAACEPARLWMAAHGIMGGPLGDFFS